MNFDISALKKYNVAGPRYTSYPTAPVFSDAYGVSEYKHDLENRDRTRDLSLYVHLPYCDTLCYFCGCNMKVSNDRGVVNSYLDLLEKEILQTKKYLGDSKVQQLHWGGGTPTHLTPAEIRRLGSFLRDNFEFSDSAECGVEIDPREITEETIAALEDVGFNRASMGLQDFDLRVQEAVNRVHSFELVSEVATWIRRHNFESLNLDLIYGLPHQTIDSFSKTVKQCLELSPDRFAVFNFAYLPEMIKHQKIIKQEDLPSPEDRLLIFENTGKILTEQGYVYVGMDHFAVENDSLVQAQKNKSLHRNFQGYSTHSGLDLIAFGSSGISQLKESYSQNIKEVKAWRESIGSGNFLTTCRGVRLTNEDLERRDLIFSMMCHFELDFGEFGNKWKIDFSKKYSEEIKSLKEFESEGCLEVTDKKLTVTPKGFLIIRNIVMAFDPYLKELQKKRPTFSRTV